MQESIKNAKRIVVKIGTSLLTKENGAFDIDYLNNIAQQVLQLENNGKKILIVTSGAIIAGSGELALKERPKEITLRQATAAIGQSIVMYEYRKAFGKFGKKVAQILLTYDSFSNRKAYANLRNSLSALLKLGVIPIINENDTIATDEIGTSFGDNDKLSALVSVNINADLLVILTDTDGLYNKNPRKHKDANLISEVVEITPKIKRMAEGATRGIGGMVTKIKAAEMATAKGCSVVIANGRSKDVLVDLIRGKELGTLFLPR